MKRNKLIVGMICLCMLGGIVFLSKSEFIKPKEEPVIIGGNTFAILLDDKPVSTLPSIGTYLVDYTCDNGSILSWDRSKGELSLSGNKTVSENCNVSFKTNPLLSEMKQGSYVSYAGNNGCMRGGTPVTGTSNAESGNSCLGNNANDTLDTNGNTYGYCYSRSYKYYVKGWRIAYTDGGRAHLISAGSPECNTRTSSTGNATYISDANTKALKYCNTNFVDGACDNTNAWAIGDNDFNKMTKEMTGTTGGYLYTSITGATKCGGVYSKEVCGYNNDLLDNGGYYWFAAAYSSSDTYGVYWLPNFRRVNGNASTDAYGLRPIIRLSSSVYVTGGNGTMDDPYTIAK